MHKSTKGFKMNLMSKVVFSYTINAGRARENATFNTFDELKRVIKNARYMKPYALRIARDIQIIDMDIKSVEYPRLVMSCHKFEDPTVRAEIPGEHIDLVVSDKIYYASDIRKLLVEKYNSVLDFNKMSHDEGRPIKFFSVFPKIGPGLPVHTVKSVHCAYLTPYDIVVDENFNQIYPEKTGAVPNSLTELLAKQKEFIR